MQRRTFLGSLTAFALAKSTASAQGDSQPVVVRAVTTGPKHHFFGYFDKCPWSATGRYLLAHEIGFADRQPKPGDPITVGTIDTADDDRFVPLATTTAWCWQQGAMLQWHPAHSNRDVIYNDVADGKYVATVRNVITGATRTLPMPVHFVRPDGLEAITLDYDRLHRLRPGYGYVALPERLADQAAPDSMGAYSMDLQTGATKLLVSLAQLAAFQPDDRHRGAHHYINHMQYCPSGAKFLFLHRWTKPGDGRFSTRLFVVNSDGTDLRLIMDATMFSHFDWRDDDAILAWARGDQGDRFYLLDLKAGTKTVWGPGSLTLDGHCSFSPNRRWVLNDTYPDKDRLQILMLIRVADGRRFDLGKFLSPPKYTGAIRCDLHPRFDGTGTKVCFDSTHTGGLRQVYVADIADIVRS